MARMLSPPGIDTIDTTYYDSEQRDMQRIACSTVRCHAVFQTHSVACQGLLQSQKIL